MADPALRQVLVGKSLGFLKRYISDFDLIEWSADGAEEAAQAHPHVRAIVTSGGQPLPSSLEGLRNLGLVALIGAGYDGLQTERLLARGVEITNAPGANAEDVADHAMALFLALVRKVTEGDRRVREGLWVDAAMVGATPSIRDLRIGVVGLGAIGTALARRLAAFGCEISWQGPRPKPDIHLPRFESVLELARACDVLFLAHRADESNRGLVSSAVLEALGPNGFLVNVSRGSAIDEQALMAALRNRTIRGAALDVFEPEPVRDDRWAWVPNCVLTPHVGGVGLGAWDAIGEIVRLNLERYFAGQPVATPIPRS